MISGSLQKLMADLGAEVTHERPRTETGKKPSIPQGIPTQRKGPLFLFSTPTSWESPEPAPQRVRRYSRGLWRAHVPVEDSHPER
jgi:hypothetical protein